MRIDDLNRTPLTQGAEKAGRQAAQKRAAGKRQRFGRLLPTKPKFPTGAVAGRARS